MQIIGSQTGKGGLEIQHSISCSIHQVICWTLEFYSDHTTKCILTKVIESVLSASRLLFGHAADVAQRVQNHSALANGPFPVYGKAVSPATEAWRFQ